MSTIEEGSNIDYPNIEAEEGFYYKPLFDLSALENISDNLYLEVELTEYNKNVQYIIDGEVVRQLNCNYTKETSGPKYDSSKMESSNWVLDVTFDGSVYNFIYTLEYTKRDTYYINYFEGEQNLNLEPSTYKSSTGLKLPIPTKEGYEFVGWFLKDISLTKIEEIPKGSENNYNLYAKYIETSNKERFVLPEASNHFTGTYKSDVWAPIIPSDAPEQSILKYNWSSSDESVLTISTFSSFAIVSSGYAVITATLISDPSYTINGVFKSTIDDVTLATEDDVNNINLVTVTFIGKDKETLSIQHILKGTFAIQPDIPSYEGYGFKGWDKEIFNIREDEVINGIFEKDFKNRFAGKTFSFIGDSLTSYGSYIPKGYATFFPYPTADVNDINLMWFMQGINKIGGKLFINDSEGGTTVQGGSHPTSEDARLSHLVCSGIYADVTIIYMGSNDCAACTKNTNGYNKESFDKYYRQMINKIKSLCPNTEIILCNLALSKLFTPSDQKDYNEVINNLANEYKLELINFSDVDLTQPLDGVKLIVDSGHPSRKGMDIIAKRFYDELITK